MSKERENKNIAARWLEGFWGASWSPTIVDDLAADDIILEFSLQSPVAGGTRQRNSWPRSTKHSAASNFIASPISQWTATMSLAVWKAAVPTRAQLSSIFWWDFYQRNRDKTFTSRARPLFESRMAESLRR
jgi:hypothetical protein